jgi:hypothetical protein
VNTTLPWPRPISHYDSDGPRSLQTGEHLDFELAGNRFRIEATNAIALNTMRTRYQVTCLECNEILHQATTGPRSYLREHLREEHGRRIAIGYAEE